MIKNTTQIDTDNQKNASNKPDFLNLVNFMIATLPVRSQEIIRKRFGLNGRNSETLEKIGQDYKITRERVRQIITDSIKNISKKTEEDSYKQAEDWIVFTISKNYGIIKEGAMFFKIKEDDYREKNALVFFAQSSKRIIPVFEKGKLEKAWAISQNHIGQVGKVYLEAKSILEKENKPLSDEEILKKLAAKIEGMEKGHILSHLSILTQIEKNTFGKWGIAHWDEINPKGTREKIHLILKEIRKPLHFTEIASLIDKHKLGKKKAHPQTVHNELIKDDRFVLIGRGIYALKQWGYNEGTIKDVIMDILSKSPKPLTKDEIIDKVMKIRKVKKTTVMINLNNGKFFEKKGEFYSIKK